MITLRKNLMAAQKMMKLQFDKHHSKREFAVGDWVYLRLQPCRQSSLVVREEI